MNRATDGERPSSVIDVVRKPDLQVAAPAASVPSPEVNFALVLSRMIDSVQQNPAELRATVYELARVKLMEQFGREDAQEVKRLVGALEDAISGVESFSQREDEQKRNAAPVAALPPGSAEVQGWGAGGHGHMPGEGDAQAAGTLEAAERRWPARGRGPVHRSFGPIMRLAIILLVISAGVAGVVAWPRLRSQPAGLQISPINDINSRQTVAPKLTRQPATVPAPVAENNSAASATGAETELGFPLPATFGVYAVSGGQLHELKALAGRVPDARVAVSAALSTPSETAIADGNLKFIVFRRDGASNAPDHVDVRVIAKVTRAMGVDPGGKARIAPSETWVIRNITIPYKVGPVEDHPEMFLIQPEAAETPLPAGRYALVVKGIGYDFAVNGQITDPRQCMERVDAVNGTFYSPCGK